MKKLLLSLGILLGLSVGAQAQCVGVGGVNNVPQPGITCQQDSIVPTYSATAIGLTPGAAPTDIACLRGSATKTIRVKQIRVSGTAATAINIVAVITKHVTIDTGGTPATSTALPVPYPHDSTAPTVSATAISWTANPTITDAAPGLITAQTVFLPVTSTGSNAGAAIFYWDDGGPSVGPPVLRGTAQEICVNLNGATAPSTGLMTVAFTWNEQTQ